MAVGKSVLSLLLLGAVYIFVSPASGRMREVNTSSRTRHLPVSVSILPPTTPTFTHPARLPMPHDPLLAHPYALLPPVQPNAINRPQVLLSRARHAPPPPPTSPPPHNATAAAWRQEELQQQGRLMANRMQPCLVHCSASLDIRHSVFKLDQMSLRCGRQERWANLKLNQSAPLEEPEAPPCLLPEQ